MPGGPCAQPAALPPSGGAAPGRRGPGTPAEAPTAAPTSTAPTPTAPTSAAPISEAPTPEALSPEALHPALWRANQIGRQTDAAWPSGFAALDLELPGGGWPARALTELLLPHPGVGEFRLLAPSLVAVQRAQRSVMLFDPPAALCGWALAALGLDLQQLVLVRSPGPLRAPGRNPAAAAQRSRERSPAAAQRVRELPPAAPRRARELPPAAADTLWALEQALKSGHVGAVLAWLPLRLRADSLRRLQLAAQGHDGPAFLAREVDARLEPSAAPLRLLLDAAGPDQLRVRLLKRRGPPLAEGLNLALPPVLSGLAWQRAMRHRLPAAVTGVAAAPSGPNHALPHAEAG